ncbi:tyrosine protein phosphatase 1 [Mycoemilia scoparia]|uniref:Tyrosine protein phosphatase 1 n=1 Tax=Mycoemilia scoparia TaxID=417184 RepID=A0A9W8DRS9_9FUNG|nr:tyrosine protein phosphatase 1 [Mycoemilia scoparia]
MQPSKSNPAYRSRNLEFSFRQFIRTFGTDEFETKIYNDFIKLKGDDVDSLTKPIADVLPPELKALYPDVENGEATNNNASSSALSEPVAGSNSDSPSPSSHSYPTKQQDNGAGSSNGSGGGDGLSIETATNKDGDRPVIVDGAIPKDTKQATKPYCKPRREDSISVNINHALEPHVVGLNRYCDILPFDYNRVKLINGLESRRGKNDYINASYVTPPPNFGFNNGPQDSYICTQAPLQNTIKDFWQMVWEQKCPKIVMLTNTHEVRDNGQVVEKSTQYWPDSPDGSDAIYLDTVGVKVSLLQKKSIDNDMFEIRQILMYHKETHSAFIVHHFLYKEWPDHGAPNDVVRFLKFHKYIEVVLMPNVHHLLPVRVSDYFGIPVAIKLIDDETMKILPVHNGPTVVHCSAGCGRSGAYCVLDIAIRFLEISGGEYGGDIINELVGYYRKQRVTMVQTYSQYLFCYRCARYAQTNAIYI